MTSDAQQTSFAHVRTARLVLDAVTPEDVDELHALSADPALWTHLPSGRHTDRDQTARQVESFVAAWRRAGLGYWAVRLTSDGPVIGVGGATLRPGPSWNLYWRFATSAQGHGYATEMGRAAIDAARAVRPDVPIAASLVEHNLASRAVAERLGLELVWRGPDVDNPDPTVQQLVFADRPLGAALQAVVQHAE